MGKKLVDVKRHRRRAPSASSSTAEKKCPICKGTGKVPGSAFDSGFDYFTGKADCPNCNGTGYV